MDEQKLVDLLKAVQTPDTEKVKAATAELRTVYYKEPQSLVLLLQTLITNDAQEIRQQAAVEALRLIPVHWPSVSKDTKPVIRSKLLESTLNESSKLVRHSGARVIAALANEDLNADGDWPELPNLLHQASQSTVVAHREVGIYILFTLLETSGETFQDELPALFHIFGQTIKDPESADVRINTLLCLGALAALIESDESPKLVTLFVGAFPDMVNVLQSVLEAGEEEQVMQAFEVFQDLLNYDSALLAPHFNDLLNFMIKVAVNKEIADESRTQAVSFLMQCVRWRKMKIQGIKGMGETLTAKCMEIATELDDEDDEDDEITPARSALGLLEMLAASLPPRQIIVPLLAALPSYVNHEDPKFRQAGILSLGVCVEGAPDFVNTQLDSLLPTIMKLLNDPVVGVRNAALNGVARLADEIAESLCQHHAQLIPALLKNLDAAIQTAQGDAENEKNLQILKAAVGALDSLTEGMEKETMVPYLESLMTRYGQLLDHPDFNVKASAASAMGSIASASEDAFLPYFTAVMPKLAPYMELKGSEDELDLRGTVSDAMGSMAAAIGAEAFRPYVQALMHSSEEALHLGHPRLKETSYVLWSVLVKVYEDQFTQFLPGVVKCLFECLEQDEAETDVELGAHASDIVGQEVTIAGMKVKVASASDDFDDLDAMGGDDDEDDWDDLNAITAVALEKEIAVEVLADILSHTKKDFVPYFEKTIELVMGLVEHQYEDLRKAALSTLWRAYTCLWSLMEDQTGVKWVPGLPVKNQPTNELLKMGEVVTTATLTCWEDEIDRSVVTDINRNVAATLKACGPAILTQENFLERTIAVLTAIITRSHPCQQDAGDEDDHVENDQEEESEYDWLVIDTALDVVIGLSAALGSTFSEVWKIFQRAILKFASSTTNYERSTAIGVLAECTANMGDAVTENTAALLKVLLHRLSDEDAETKSNAAYAIGLLIFHSSDSAAYLPSYNTILAKLEPLLHTQLARTMDNAAGCVCRMIMAHQDAVPLDDILSALVGLLPLKEDFEENKPIYDCLAGLYHAQQPTLMSLTPQLIPVFAAILSPPQDQLEDETRAKVVGIVKFIASQSPALIQGHEILVAAASS